ncbi:hypothetical protein [Bradyrhizobium sp.]|uniref:hypothetical protein n=1 Tax=Bradyrhizobium sp. TaxID=376 RepID=UPI0025BD7F87|nr:hypothetical protein [Bradyrhizobium sp.]
MRVHSLLDFRLPCDSDWRAAARDIPAHRTPELQTQHRHAAVPKFIAAIRPNRHADCSATCGPPRAGIRQVNAMPYFNFDLVTDERLDCQGGMILEDTDGAIDKANSLASELSIARPELLAKGYAVRVTDEKSRELYRKQVAP